MASDGAVYYYEVGKSDPPAYFGRDGKVMVGACDLSLLLTFGTVREAADFYAMINGCVNGCKLRLRSNVWHGSDAQPRSYEAEKVRSGGSD